MYPEFQPGKKSYKKHITIGIIAVAILLGLTGYAVWSMGVSSQNEHTERTESQAKKDSEPNDVKQNEIERPLKQPAKKKQPQKAHIKRKNETFNTYTNTTVGFAFDFPAQANTEVGCQKRTSVTDRDGSTVQLSEPIYGARSDWTSLSVVRMDNAYIIIPKQLVSSSVSEYRTPQGIGYPKDCRVENTSVDVIKNMNNETEHRYSYTHTAWIVFKNTESRAITKKAQSIETIRGRITQHSLGALADGRQAVDFQSESDDFATAYFGPIRGAWYYPDKKTLAIMASWSGGDFMYTKPTPNYEITASELLNSFQLF